MKRFMFALAILFSTVTAYAGFEAYNGTTSLNIFDKIQCSTGLTCTRSNGKLLMTSSPTVSGSALTVTALEDTDALLTLKADESDDNGDDWQIESDKAANSLIFSNDTSGSQVAKFTLTTAGALSSVVSITGAGTGTLSGFKWAQVASTTTAITAAQCGSTFVSNSADVMALPEASTVLGCRLTFVCGTADDFDINPDDADIIGPVSTTNGTTGVVTLAPSAGDAIRCTDIGGAITLEAIAADRWAQVGGGNGIWTDVN